MRRKEQENGRLKAYVRPALAIIVHDRLMDTTLPVSNGSAGVIRSSDEILAKPGILALPDDFDDDLVYNVWQAWDD